ncbi:MAG: terminase [Catenulispora phage 69_17]|nr:MAG: terminase [Catenulispora phage 69_17]
MLSRKQIQAYVESDARINVWEGAVRSGKTISSLMRWLAYVRDAPRGGELAVIGKTAQTVHRNVFSPLMDPGVVGSRVAKSISYTSGAPTGTILGRTVHVIGANDAKAEPKVRGLTGAGAYVDEATVLPREFWNQLVARQSTPGAKIFATTNPDSPAHWLRTEWLKAGNPSVRSWHFTLDDNPFLDPEYVAHLKRSYVGLWYRRFILGEWVAAEGAIYDMLDHQQHLIAPHRIPPILDWIVAGIDYGTSNPFHAVLVGRAEDKRLYVTAEYRYESAKAQRQLTDRAYSEAFRAFLATAPIPRTQLQGVNPRYIVVDPSAASFRVQLHEDGTPSWPADNDVLDGIRTTANVLGNDKLRISTSCRALIDEMSGYSWDPKAQLLGEDRPLKIADHGPDALRYALHTTRADWARAIDLFALAA